MIQGSVRWVCFELIDDINFDYSIDINIDNIWSQAYHLAYYDKEFNCKLTKEDILENEARNNKYK